MNQSTKRLLQEFTDEELKQAGLIHALLRASGNYYTLALQAVDAGNFQLADKMLSYERDLMREVRLLMP